MAKRRKNKVAKAIKKRRAAAEKASLPKTAPVMKEPPATNMKTNIKTSKWKGVKGKFGKIAGALTSLIGDAGKKVSKIIKPEAKRKYAEAKVLSGSRLEEEGVHRTSLSRDLDIFEKIRKTKGSYNKDSKDDFIAWLEGDKRALGRDKEYYSGLRAGEKLRPSVRKSMERHQAKEKGIHRKGDRYDIVQAAHKHAVFRDFEAERLERLENSQKAIKERQGQLGFAESHPLKYRDFEAERLEKVRAREEEVRQRQSQKIEPTTTPESETAQGPIAQAQEASSTPTGNQQNAGATQGNAQTNNQEAAGATQGGGTTSNQEAADASSGSGDDSYDAKLKALRKKGRANEYAADRIDQERKEVIDMINAGNYKDAAGALGFSGDYTAEKANELRQAAEKHAMDAVNEGAGIMDYVNAYHVPGAIGGAAILAGTGVALMGDNGRKSNEQLYNSPF